jgi:biopolymer transport protein ExbB
MTDLLELIRQGGWIMYPIGLFSVVGLTIAIERMFALRRALVIDPEVVKLVDAFDGDTSPEQALKACRQRGGAYARIIEEVIRARNLSHGQVIETMHATGRTQLGMLERGLTVLEIIASTSPLLGLLGTVLGMVAVFNAITAQGLGNPQVLSDGISKALVTTVAGLIVAIPALACHSWLSRRVDDLGTEMQERATGFIAKLVTLRGERSY